MARMHENIRIKHTSIVDILAGKKMEIKRPDVRSHLSFNIKDCIKIVGVQALQATKISARSNESSVKGTADSFRTQSHIIPATASLMVLNISQITVWIFHVLLVYFNCFVTCPRNLCLHLLTSSLLNQLEQDLGRVAYL